MKTLEQIAAELPQHDPQDMPVDAVNAFLQRLVQPVTDTETVGIFDALDRVLACDVVSPLSVPPHDNSAMDGYAFAGAQLVPGQPLTLRVVGTALAGKAWVGGVAAGVCCCFHHQAPAATATSNTNDTNHQRTRPCWRTADQEDMKKGAGMEKSAARRAGAMR